MNIPLSASGCLLELSKVRADNEVPQVQHFQAEQQPGLYACRREYPKLSLEVTLLSTGLAGLV